MLCCCAFCLLGVVFLRPRERVAIIRICLDSNDAAFDPHPRRWLIAWHIGPFGLVPFESWPRKGLGDEKQTPVLYPGSVTKGQVLKGTDRGWHGGHFHNSERALGVQNRTPLWERYKDDDHARIASTQYLASGKETRISRVSMSASMAAIKLDPKERQESDGKDHTLEVLQVYRNIEL